MSSKLQKWGNSIGLRIPQAIIKQANLHLNSEVEISCKNKRIVILPQKKELKLKQLLSQITKDNLHSEETSLREGKEIW